MMIYQVLSGAKVLSKSIPQEECTLVTDEMMFCCESALEAQRAGARAAANTSKKTNKRLAFTRATCDG